MGRRTSLVSLAGDKVEDVPGTSDLTLLHVPLDKLVATRFNPRRNFGTEEQLLEFGLVLKKRQLQPAVVVSRSAYLKLWPNEAEGVGDATYVIANGERRYRASKEAGLGGLWVVHREEVASSKADFLDAVLSENNDRDDLDPIERALGMETMVTELGGAGAVAAHYGKSPGWVSQQRKLLKLVPDLQALVSSGEMSQREGYRIAGLPADKQVAEWRAELARRKEEADRRKTEAERRKEEGKSRKRPAALPPQRQEAAGEGNGEADAASPVATNGDLAGQSGFSALNGESDTGGVSAEQATGAEGAADGFSALNGNASEQADPEGSPTLETAGQGPATNPPDEDAQPGLHDQAAERNEGTRGFWESVESLAADWLPLQEPDVLARMLQERMSPSNFEQMVKVAQTLI